MSVTSLEPTSCWTQHFGEGVFWEGHLIYGDLVGPCIILGATVWHSLWGTVLQFWAGDICSPVGSSVSFSIEIRNPERICPAKNMTCPSVSLFSSCLGGVWSEWLNPEILFWEGLIQKGGLRHRTPEFAICQIPDCPQVNFPTGIFQK